MTPLPFFQVDAFAEKPFTGNPAAVMPLVLGAWILAHDLVSALVLTAAAASMSFIVAPGRA